MCAAHKRACLLCRLFALVEQSASGHQATTPGNADSGGDTNMSMQTLARASVEDQLIKSGIFSVVQSLLAQCSTEFCNVRVYARARAHTICMVQMIGDRLYTFVVDNEFGSRIAAQCVGELIYAVVKVCTHARTRPDLLLLLPIPDSRRQILPIVLRTCAYTSETIAYWFVNTRVIVARVIYVCVAVQMRY